MGSVRCRQSHGWEMFRKCKKTEFPCIFLKKAMQVRTQEDQTQRLISFRRNNSKKHIILHQPTIFFFLSLSFSFVKTKQKANEFCSVTILRLLAIKKSYVNVLCRSKNSLQTAKKVHKITTSQMILSRISNPICVITYKYDHKKVFMCVCFSCCSRRLLLWFVIVSAVENFQAAKIEVS